MTIGWITIARGVVLGGMAVAFLVTTAIELRKAHRDSGFAPAERSIGDRGVRVLLQNHAAPQPVPTYTQDISVVALQPSELVTPDDDSIEKRLTLKTGSRLRVLPDSDGLVLISSEWPSEKRWPVTRIWLQPLRTEPAAPPPPTSGNKLSLRDLRTFEAADKGSVFAIDFNRQRRSYRGNLEIRLHSPRALIAVNHLPLEAYVEGVVGVEMKPGWYLEALKSQAIVSRSYAFERSLRARAKPDQAWDITDTATSDQEYRGTLRVTASVRRAVLETRGVVTLAGPRDVNLFAPYFCASSGGWTAASDTVEPGGTDFSRRVPLGTTVMRPVEDPACEPAARALGLTNTHLRSEVTVSAKEIGLVVGKIIQPTGKMMGYVQRVEVGRRRPPPDSRVETVVVTHTPGEREEISAHIFRMGLEPVLRASGDGRTSLRSTRWSDDSPKRVQVNDRVSYRFTSYGYGHGVGMSQISAWWLARQGLNAKAILGRFYGGSQLQLRALW